MKPLLSIHTIPISIEHKVTRASLQHNSTPAKVNISRQRGGLNIQRVPMQVHMDNTESRASMGLKSPQRLTDENASKSVAVAREGTRNFVEMGNRVVDSHGRGNPVGEVAAARAMSVPDTALTYIPSTGPQFSTEGGTLSVDFRMDKLTFDWNINMRPFLEYVPPSVEFEVKQYPDVVIEYVGDPIYVPPSANPNYVSPVAVDIKG
ncbi:hypothetical protein FACS1894191_6980 [Clostridia bacterium]|nr:hypothetical protein FACS1894191_6980 [Clostridia bacterium]